MGEAMILFVEDCQKLSLASPHCRICHETEFESCKSFEAPCACSGTVKFAHRDCIQRWCDEKGNTVCEICLQKYEPGYRVPPPLPKESELIDAAVTIRDSLEIVPRRREHDLESQELLEQAAAECDSAAVRRATYCRFLALMVTVILLVRHLLSLFNGQESQEYPFTIFTLLILRTSGIVIPMYVVIRAITAIQKSIQKNIRHQLYDSDSNSDTEDEENEQQQRV